MIEAVIGIVAGSLGIGGMVYQFLFKSTGLTYPMILFLGISTAIWMAYGFAIENPIIFAVNLILVVLLALTGVRKRIEE